MKAKILFIAFFFLLIGNEVFAQSGSNPFVGSNHSYYVNSTDNGVTHDGAHTDNKYYWYLTDDSDVKITTPGTIYTAGQAWGTDVAPIANLFKIDITWGTSASGNTYHLYLEEYSGNNCITKRKIIINVIPNDFDISIADLGASCSDASGSIIVNDDENNLGNTVKIFTIDMKTQADMTASGAFIPDWKFDYEVTVGNGSFVSVSFDDNTSDTNDGTANTGVVTVDNDDYSIQMTVTFSNVWNKADDVTVTLSKGVELTYNTPDGDPSNDEGTVTINALPNTSDIMTD